MQVQDLTKPEIQKIEHDFETSEEASRIADEADTIIRQLKQIRELAAALDSGVDTLYKKSQNQPNWRNVRYSLSEVLTEDTDLLNETAGFLAVEDIQLARYEQLFKDAEASAHDLAQEEADTARYGSYEDQVRGTYYGSR